MFAVPAQLILLRLVPTLLHVLACQYDSPLVAEQAFAVLRNVALLPACKPHLLVCVEPALRSLARYCNVDLVSGPH